MIAHVSKTLNRPSVRMTGLSWYVFVFKWLNYIYITEAMVLIRQRKIYMDTTNVI